MIYCFNFSKVSIPSVQREIDRAKKEDSFLYYDSKKKNFLDQDGRVVSVDGLSVMPVSGVLQLPDMIRALSDGNACIPNTLEEIDQVENWYHFIEPNRNIISFLGKDLQEDSFLTYLIEFYHGQDEVFLKTKKKDFNGVVKLEDLLNSESDLRKAFSYHLEDEFLLSNKVSIDSDEFGSIEYRGFVLNNRIMNVSRILDSTYHYIPQEVIDYFYQVIDSLPNDFPYSYVLDVFSHDHQYDILEFNPIETSGKYLYNSIFDFSDDLLHQDIENVSEEKDKSELSYSVTEHKIPSTVTEINHTFAKDYSDIQQFGQPMEGFIHVNGLKPGQKIDIGALLTSSDIHDSEPLSDEDLFATEQSTPDDSDDYSQLFNQIKAKMKVKKK